MANPIPSPPWTLGRDDMGVDASSPPGSPYYCPASCVRVGPPIPGWFPNLYLFQFNPHLSGTPNGCQYFYVAEGISAPLKSSYRTGEVMCRSTGGGIETGWGSPTSHARTLADELGDAAAAHNPPGNTTTWGESFKNYFGIGGGPGEVMPGMSRPGTPTNQQNVDPGCSTLPLLFILGFLLGRH